MRSTILILLLALLIPACATKAGTGTAVGAGVGGLAGHAIGGTTGMLIGGAVGGALGFSVGKSMDDEDRRRAAQALEYNRAMEWENAQGEVYRVEPTRTSYIDGRECRNFRMLADVEGRAENITGTACRRPDGTWETISG